jgi:hypothetical protein
MPLDPKTIIDAARADMKEKGDRRNTELADFIRNNFDKIKDIKRASLAKALSDAGIPARTGTVAVAIHREKVLRAALAKSQPNRFSIRSPKRGRKR